MSKKGIAGGLTNYGDQDFSLYLRRSFARSMGISDPLLTGPIIGIAAAESGFNNCHRNMPELVEAVSRGVLVAGGLPRVSQGRRAGGRHRLPPLLGEISRR